MEDILTRSVANIIPNPQALANRLAQDTPLNIYLGIDATATRIHLGHAVTLRKLQAFAQAGHNVTFLIGDFTALIGDTSDKDTERPILTQEQIQINFNTYQSQASKILDFSLVKIVNNSQWLSNLNFTDIIKLCQQFSAGDFYSRELIKTRLQNGKHVGLHEVLYSVMQGYDSYHLDTDLQIGGTDQTFNMQAGRTLQKNLRDKESYVMALEFLTGTDGRKMSKSWGNAIWLEDSPNDMYGKIMSIKDELIIEYFTHATNTSIEQINQIQQELKQGDNPMEFKKILAHKITSELHSNELANQAQQFFQNTVQSNQIPQDTPTINLAKSNWTPIELLSHLQLTTSNSESRRLIEQGGFRINNQQIIQIDSPLQINESDVIQLGKRKYLKLSLNQG